jgi:hypothetical protein
LDVFLPPAVQVRSELAPWEKQITEVQSRIDVAAAERDLLAKKHTDAKQRLADAQVRMPTLPHAPCVAWHHVQG